MHPGEVRCKEKPKETENRHSFPASGQAVITQNIKFLYFVFTSCKNHNMLYNKFQTHNFRIYILRSIAMKIIKRNGAEVVFDIGKIKTAITKDNNAVEESVRMTPLQIDRIEKA